MPRQPWLKFFPSDWRGEAALRLCTIGARGLWMEMLCLMHEAEPYGHLKVNGHPVTDTQLSCLTGVPLDQITSHLGELERSGAFSKTSDGVIYSRRMTRDAKRAATNAKNGKAGGNPQLVNGSVNRPDNPPVKPSVPQKPEARKQDSKNLFQISVGRSLTRPERSKQEIKAIWQADVIEFGRDFLEPEQHAVWAEKLVEGDRAAVELANHYDKQIKAIGWKPMRKRTA